MDMDEVRGPDLRELRERAGLKVWHVQKYLCVSQATVYNWESADQTPKPKHLEPLAKLYGVSVQEITRAAAASVRQNRRKGLTAGPDFEKYTTRRTRE